MPHIHSSTLARPLPRQQSSRLARVDAAPRVRSLHTLPRAARHRQTDINTLYYFQRYEPVGTWPRYNIIPTDPTVYITLYIMQF